MPDGTIVIEGRGMRNEEEQRSFWKALLAKYPSLQTGKVRKATTREISYFWATTVFDIDEPFFAIDAGPQTFVVHMGQEHGIYTFDLVGDLRDLRSSAPANFQDLQQPQKTELGDQRTAEVAHEPDSECRASPGPDKTVQAVEQSVTTGRLIHKVPPKYPKAALKAHIEGTVVLCAVIGKDGRITNLRAASGPKELVDPAIKAVQQWVYKPYLVAGEAVEVETEIRVDFELE